MPQEKEGFPHQESAFDRLLQTRAADGWHFAGREELTRTRFSKDAKFEQVPYQTENSIREKWLQIAKQQDPSLEFEAELVLDENTEKLRRFREIGTAEEYRTIISNLREENRAYLVFVRRVEE